MSRICERLLLCRLTMARVLTIVLSCSCSWALVKIDELVQRQRIRQLAGGLGRRDPDVTKHRWIGALAGIPWWPTGWTSEGVAAERRIGGAIDHGRQPVVGSVGVEPVRHKL